MKRESVKPRKTIEIGSIDGVGRFLGSETTRMRVERESFGGV